MIFSCEKLGRTHDLDTNINIHIYAKSTPILQRVGGFGSFEMMEDIGGCFYCDWY